MAKLLIAALIIACIAPLFIKGPDGEPLMSLQDWMPGPVDELIPQDVQEMGVPHEPTTVYKWQDENGQWHFSSAPPADVTDAETMELDGDINIMQAPPVERTQQAAASSHEVALPSGPMTVSPDQVKDMMETVTNLQETVDQRKADVDAVLPSNP